MTDSNSQLPAPVESTPSPRQRLWPLWLVALLTFILVVALAVWNWQQWQWRQQLQQTVGELQQSDQQLDQRYGAGADRQADRLQSLEQRLSNQQSQLATFQRQIDHNARELLATGNRTRTDWLLAEAEYLMRIANQRLQVEKDIRGALAALNEADKVLRESDDVGVFTIRKQLAREVLALKAISDVDRTGLYLTLEAAIASMQELTDDTLYQGEGPALFQDQPATPAAGDPGIWARAWQQVKTTVGNAVSYRRLDQPVQPLMSPEQAAYARLNMQLMLEEAELAVLRGNQVLYDRALAKARGALEQWYDGTDNRITALLDTLAELEGKQVDPELPDISESLALLKARLSGRLNTESSESADSEGGNGQ
ncbi:MAG: uroporphyrinogen-III C-methyltransferase [Pseudomonadales bacterium]|uniref:uroporphyrinogen-III C-methyltransferase n=1 Tax=Marinobacter xestospongiae TaxID=994319 RepID=UPI0020049849|nr:uroporphyrinogen-III C-methyltransferase [Pseudomonadales bacterium]MCK7567835.1 uroporphyrinogen-III C-methyltransferase [Marinobacter xestospongiae]